MANTAEVAELLNATTLPKESVEEFLVGAPDLWLMSAPASVLAADLVLCHPPLKAGEIRAAAQPLGAAKVRITVVAPDRRGLLADTAAVLAAERLSVVSASVATWPADDLALHALTVDAPGFGQEDWDDLEVRLRALGAGSKTLVHFTPTGTAKVDWFPATFGRCIVTVRAPDQLGLLWAICRWFAENGASIEAAHIGARGGTAEDRFVIVGTPDLRYLAGALSASTAPPQHRLLQLAKTVLRIGSDHSD